MKSKRSRTLTNWLRAFSGKRQLREDLAEASSSRLELQGQIHELRSEVERWREEAAEARKNERTVYRLLVNVEMQLKFGIAPFPDAPKLPEHLVSHDTGGPVDSGYIHGRQLRDAGLVEAQEEFRAYMDKATGVS